MEVQMNVASNQMEFDVDVGAEYRVVGGKAYEGDYVITPTDEPQILPTEKRYLTDNIVVNAIPSSYGKITWNGSILTVS